MHDSRDRLLDWTSLAVAAFLALLPAIGLVGMDEPTHWMALALLWFLAHAALKPDVYRRYFVPDASALALAGIRVWTCVILLGYVLVSDLPSTARLPREMLPVSAGRNDLWFRLPELSQFLANEAALGYFRTFAALALAAGALGALTRLTVPLAALASLLYVGIFWQYTYFYHQCLIGMYVLGAVSLTPCGDVLSIDAWLRRRRGKPPLERASAVYAWSRYLCWTVLALPYFFAGLSKLHNGGWMWWEPSNLRVNVYRDSLQKGVLEPAFGLFFFSAPDLLFVTLGLITLLIEVGFPLVLVSRRARRILPVGAAGMHLGIFALQNFLFVDALLMQAIFFDWKRLASWIRDRWDGSFAPRPPAGVSGYAYLVGQSAVVISFAWLLHIESYPLSSWGMYSHKRKESGFVYYVTWADHENLGQIPAPYERCFPAPTFNPYLLIPTYAFQDPQRQDAARKFFLACGAEINRGKPAGERITAFRVEQWYWDWKQQPEGPPYGVMLDTHETKIAPAR